MRILENIKKLIVAMKEQDFIPFFDGYAEDALTTIDDCLSSMVNYQNSVITMEFRIPIVRMRYDGDALRDAIQNMDATRRAAHESAIVKCRMLNRISAAYGCGNVIPVNTDDRYEVADFIGVFCDEMFRSGQSNRARETYPTHGILDSILKEEKK